MLGIHTLNQGDSLREDGDIAFQYAFDHLADGELVPLETASFQIGIDDGLLFNATVDLQACIF